MTSTVTAGALTKTLGMTSTLLSRLPGQLFQVVTSRTLGKAAAAPLKFTAGRGNLFYKIGAGLVSYGWAAFVFVLGLLIWILKTVFSRIVPAFVKGVVDDWQENRINDYMEQRDKYLKSRVLKYPFLVFEFVTQFVGVVLFAVFIKIPKYIVDHFCLIAGLLLVAAIASMFMLYMPGAASAYRETTIAGYESANAASNVGNAALSANEIIMPLNNFMLYSSVTLLIQIEDGATYALALNDPEAPAPGGSTPSDPASGRRVLQQVPDDRSAGEKFVELVMNVLIFVLWFFHQILLIVVEVFFKYFFPFIQDALSHAQFWLRRIGCIISGQACGLLEILDAIVNLIWTPLAFVFGRIQIACGADQLSRMNCDCAGYLWSLDGPGIYRNMEPCGVADPRYSSTNFTEYEDAPGRRLTQITCSQNQDGDYVEEMGDATSLSKTSDLLKACPTARRAFHPYTHAQDMHRFDTHDCITHCVMGVSMVSCDDDAANHTVSVLGTCSGDAPSGIDETEARNRLGFLGVDLSKLTPYRVKTKRRLQEQQTGMMTRLERIAALRSSIPLRFSVEGIGECDLSVVPKDVYEFMDTARCVMGRAIKVESDWTPWAPGRHLQEATNHAVHTLRKLKRAQSVSDVQSLYEAGDHVSVRHIMQWESKQRLSKKNNKKPKGRGLQLVLPDDEGTFAPSTSPTVYDDPNTDPVNPSDPIPCLGRVLCPDQQFCAVEAKYCKPPTTWSPIVWYSHYVQRFSGGVESFDAYAFISKAKKCYQTRTRSPYEASYVFKSRAEKLADTETEFCPGEIGPTDYKFGSLSYSPDADISTLCTGTANFEGCKCPHYYYTRGYSVDYAGLNSSGYELILNGLHWVLDVFWLLLNSVTGFVDDLLRSAGLPSFSGISANAYGLTDAEMGKCTLFHTYDAAITALFFILFWGFLQSVFYVVEWFVSVWLNPVNTFLCIPDPTSDAEKMIRLKDHAYDGMIAEYENKYEAIRARRSNGLGPIEISFKAKEHRSAMRFKRWLIDTKKYATHNVVFDRKLKEMRRAEKDEECKVTINFKRSIY